MTMQHRFKMPPGGSARDCWETPVNCSRIAPAIIESKWAIQEYAQAKRLQRLCPDFGPKPAIGWFPYYG